MRRLTAVFFLAVLFCGTSQVLTYREYRRVQREQRLERGLASVARVYRRLREAESGERGFLLTGKPVYLTPYKLAIPLMDGLWKDVESQPADALPFDRHKFHDLVQYKLAELAETLALAATQGQEAALERLNRDDGREVMQTLRETVQPYLDKSFTELIQVQDEAHDLLLFQVITAVLGFCMVSWTYFELSARLKRGAQAGRFMDEVTATVKQEGVNATAREVTDRAFDDAGPHH